MPGEVGSSCTLAFPIALYLGNRRILSGTCAIFPVVSRRLSVQYFHSARRIVLPDGDVPDRLGLERYDAAHRGEYGGHAAARIDSLYPRPHGDDHSLSLGASRSRGSRRPAESQTGILKPDRVYVSNDHLLPAVESLGDPDL